MPYINSQPTLIPVFLTGCTENMKVRIKIPKLQVGIGGGEVQIDTTQPPDKPTPPPTSFVDAAMASGDSGAISTAFFDGDSGIEIPMPASDPAPVELRLLLDDTIFV